jgi:PIN domain nuclease of toxin-antitoxin system
VRALIDANAWLWFTGNSDRLGPQTRSLMVDPANDLFLSVVSAWEIVIKARLGKLDGIGDPAAFIRARLRRQRIVPLPVALDHALAVETLPLHHRDPFDRLLIAQAQAEALVIITSDRALWKYDVDLHDASE